MSKLSYEKFEELVVAKLKELVEEATGGDMTIEVLPCVRKNEKSKGVTFGFENIKFKEAVFQKQGDFENEFFKGSVRPLISLGDIYNAGDDIYPEDIEPIAKGIIAALYEMMRNMQTDFIRDLVGSYPSRKEDVLRKVEAKLLNKQANEGALNAVGHRIWHDLAMFYTVPMNNDEAFVTVALMEKLGITEEELYAAAMRNMAKNHEAVIVSLDKIFDNMVESGRVDASEIPECDIPEECREFMPHICRFNNKEFGAISFLLPGMLEKIQKVVGEQFYVFPSSIHDVIIQPVKGHEAMVNRENVEEWNQVVLPANERLTNQAYFYNGTDFEDVFDNPAPIV